MRARILVIEDNETNLELMVYLLRAFGYAPLTAVNGEQGIETALREKPDLVVCDIQLPGIDGYGVAIHLKNADGMASMPVVAVTALAMVGDRDKILGGGFDAYISKPIEPELFVSQIEAILPPALRARSVPPVGATRDPAPAIQPQPGARVRVLVVDDTAANLEFLRSVLQASGYSVRTSTNVTEAVELARAEPPDLVLSDLHMHPHAGTELLARFQADAALSAVPVMILSSTSAYARAGDECLARGARRFLQLPIEPQSLLANISEVLKERA